jgi:anti-sigma regulatory factor (Ser/Thr protein kinase)
MGRDELSETAQLVASELIANAVVHGAGPITVSVAAADGTVALEVQDRGRAARLDTGAPMPGPDSAGGRGLPIVRALARTVEVDPGRDGGTTRVTAVLATPGGVQVER